MYRTEFWALWEKARVGCVEGRASRHVYYLGWNRSPAQVRCMRQALGPGALGRPRGSGWRGRWEGGSGWGTHVNPWLFHFNVWRSPLQYKKFKKQLKEKKSLLPLSCVSSGGSVVGLIATFSKRAYAIPRSAAPRAPASAAVHCWPVPPQETLKHSSVWINT